MSEQNLLDRDTPSAQETAPVVEAIDGKTLIEMFEGAAGWLERHVPHINALNVFPVPDGDTGMNMMLTVQSAVKELRKLRDQEPAAVAEVAQKMARGALMGARGNSGVILSQILRGFARGLEEKDRATVNDLVAALEQAADAGYKAVMKPVEGTILTVIREVAEEAKAHLHDGGSNSVTALWDRIVTAAKEAELRTPELLPVLREAGVTDSGGHGLWVFLDGARRRLRGEEIEAQLDLDSDEIEEMMSTIGHPTQGETLEGEWGYDIQYLIKARPGNTLNVNAIREYISSIGDCPLVVGDEELVKVHVHCPNPGPAIEYGANQGSITDVVVEDMDLQAQEFLVREEQPEVRPVTTATRTDEVTGIGIVAVAPGEGLVEVFRSLGVSEVVSGGQTMNPSTEDLLDAVEAVRADTVIILPNNKNIILAAQQVPELSSKQVHILPTRTVPQGIAAVMSFNYAGDIQDNLEAMQEAVEHVQSGEVTTGVRTTVVNGVSVTAGDMIGILNGELVAAEQSTEAVIRALLDRMDLSEYEIATFYHGADVSPDEAQQIVDSLAAEYDALEMDLIAGGQPHYHFIFSVE